MTSPSTSDFLSALSASATTFEPPKRVQLIHGLTSSLPKVMAQHYSRLSQAHTEFSECPRTTQVDESTRQQQLSPFFLSLLGDSPQR